MKQARANQSLAGYVRDNLKLIESEIESGIPIKDILLAVNETGYKTSLDSFKVTLLRARQKARLKETKEQPRKFDPQKPEEEIQLTPVRIADLISEDKSEPPLTKKPVESPRQRRERLAAQFVADDSIPSSVKRMLDKGTK